MKEKRTLLQNKIFFALLHQLEIDPAERRTLAYHASAGRTNQTSQLTKSEMSALINTLKKQPAVHQRAGQRQRLKLLGLCYDLGWVTPEGKADKAHLNRFLLARGVVKKHIERMSIDQLNRTLSQLEALRKKTFLTRLSTQP